MRIPQDALDINYSISFTYLASNDTVSFSGFITGFNDEFKQEWQEEQVYGRMDPILFYKNTTRKMGFSFSVPSESKQDAEANHIKLQKLISFCYPVYEAPRGIESGVQTSQLSAVLSQNYINLARGYSSLVSTPPLISVKFANIISSNLSGGKLIVKSEGVKYRIDETSTFYSSAGRLFTNVYTIDMNLTVLHSSPLGWEKGNNANPTRRNSKFPYNF